MNSEQTRKNDQDWLAQEFDRILTEAGNRQILSSVLYTSFMLAADYTLEKMKDDVKRSMQ